MQRTYFPGITDLVVVTDPAEIRTIPNDSRFDRDFREHGPVRNVQRLRKILRIFSLNGRLFETILPRSDSSRAAAQDEARHRPRPVGRAAPAHREDWRHFTREKLSRAAGATKPHLAFGGLYRLPIILQTSLKLLRIAWFLRADKPSFRRSTARKAGAGPGSPDVPAFLRRG